MYDNIDFILRKENCPGVDFLATIPQYLSSSGIAHGVDRFGQKYVSGYYENFCIKVTEPRIKIYKGSLCKYFLGDNFKTLSRSDSMRAVEKMSDELHIPVDLANITRIDAAQNLIVQHPERAYYSLLGEAQYYERAPKGNGLYYNNNLRTLVFYGKEHEQKVKGQPIPELYRERHIIRYEMRYKERLAKQFNRPEIIAATLYDELFYTEIVNRWRDEYRAIKKNKSNLFNMKPTGSTKELLANLALIAILEMGQPNVLNIVKIWQEGGEISRKQAYDLRTAINSLSNCPKGEAGSELIIELDRKIKEAAQFH